MPYKAVKVFMGDTATSVNQGGASGSTGIQLGGKQMRMAAAEARRVLVEMAAQELAIPADKLKVNDGVITVFGGNDDMAKSTSYAKLLGGKYFNVQLEWNKQMGNALYAPGKAQPKPYKDHKIVGQPIKRDDVAPKVFAQEDYVVDIKVPGMVHGRVIRPKVAGSVPVKVDESSIKDIPGAQVVHQNGFLGVVAHKEWDAIRAMEKLKVEWSTVEPPFPNQNALYDHIRKAAVRKQAVEGKTVGNVDEAFKTAAKVIEAEYEWPFQSHAPMGPACAVVEINGDKVNCWSGTQKSHFVQIGLASQLGVPLENVHVRWTTGPGSYGRNDADDCAADCAVLAKAVGKPVRLQYMRDQGTGWDPKGPASIHTREGRARRAGQRHRLRVRQQGLLAGRRRHQRHQAVRHAGGPDARRRAEVRRRLRRAGGILRVRQQADLVGDHRAAARSRVAAAHLASARPRRSADPLRQRVVHGRTGGGDQPGPDRVPAEAHQGRPRHRA